MVEIIYWKHLKTMGVWDCPPPPTGWGFLRLRKFTMARTTAAILGQRGHICGYLSSIIRTAADSGSGQMPTTGRVPGTASDILAMYNDIHQCSRSQFCECTRADTHPSLKQKCCFLGEVSKINPLPKLNWITKVISTSQGRHLQWFYWPATSPGTPALNSAQEPIRAPTWKGAWSWWVDSVDQRWLMIVDGEQR